MQLPEIFLIGSLWFWLLVFGEVIAVSVMVERERGAIATLTFLATLLLLQFLGHVNICGYVIQHPLLVVLGAAGYFALGMLLAVAKWWFYVREQRAWYDELRAAFLRMYGYEPSSAMPEELQHSWQNCLVLAKKNGQRLVVRPLAARHKADILRWMAYWPWSFSWTMLKDPVRKAFLTIYHNIAEYLQEISDRAFKGVEADLPAEEEIPAAQRRDPVLAEFGIEAEPLGAERTAAHATVMETADPKARSEGYAS
jgi:hypothetical protein